MKGFSTYLIVTAVLILAIAGLLFYYERAEAPTRGSGHDAAAKADLVVADAPTPGSVVASPLTVTGKARGNWYFEASFPVRLLDSNGNVIASGPAQAQGDWMTTDFVPFSISLSFPKQPAGSVGTLILHNDNPSGDPARDDYLEVPVRF